MIDLVKWFKRLFRNNRRQHKRYKVLDQAYCVIGSDPAEGERMRLLDIGEGGLAMAYAFSDPLIQKTGEISLMAGDKVYIKNVLVETITDLEIKDLSETMVTMRRRGVRFKRLKNVDKKHLMDFIKNCTVCGPD
ncbi:MAG: hypothetical protein AB1641_22815 [Thermodesulfobacteriota bacterium]